jgi:predicted transcriptional regulator
LIIGLFIYTYILVYIYPDDSLIDDDEYRDLIEFISRNQGCTAEQLVEGLKDKISRVPVYERLKVLLKEGLVKDESTNRRDYRLYVDRNNPSISIPQQLEDIEKRFKNLLNKSEPHWTQFEKTMDKALDMIVYDSNVDLFLELIKTHGSRSYSAPTMILQIISDSIIVHSTTIWISKFHDKDALNKLFANVYIKLASLTSHYLSYLSNIQSGHLERIQFGGAAANRALSPIQLMYVSRSLYKEIGIQEEVEALFDSLWIFNKDVRKLLFPEIELYKWGFRCEVDDWRNLLEIYKNNPDQTAHNYYLQQREDSNKTTDSKP